MSINNAPLLSFVVTTYNYERYLDECVRSCLNQSGALSNFEVVVVDDGSTDDTALLLNEYSETRLKIFRICNSGIEIAANYGFEMAGGEFIVRVDADDRVHPNFLSTFEQHLLDDNTFYYADYSVIDGNGISLANMSLPEFDRNEVFSRGDFLATGTIYHSSLIEKIGGYNTKNVNSGLENYEFIIDLVESGAEGFHLPKVLFDYRRHSKNLSVISRKRIIANGRALFLRKKLGAYKTNSYHPYGLILESM